MQYILNQTARAAAEFRDLTDTLTDPTTVTVTVTDPLSNATTYTYGTDDELVRAATGVYYIDILLDDVGDWTYRFVSTGTPATDRTATITVSASKLTQLRTQTQAILATAVDSSTWTTTIIDQAIRQALRHYSEIGPVSEQTLTITIAGYVQDVSILGNVARVLAVAYPWTEDEEFRDKMIGFSVIGTTRIRVEGACIPSVGELIRVRYREFHTITGLDNAANTSVPREHDTILATYAAAEACRLRLRQIAENPAIPREAIKVLPGLADQWEGQAIQWLSSTMKPASNPSWNRIGL